MIDREQSRNKTIQHILNNVLYDEFVSRTYIGWLKKYRNTGQHPRNYYFMLRKTEK